MKTQHLHHQASKHLTAAIMGVLVLMAVVLPVASQVSPARASDGPSLLADYDQWNIVSFGDATLTAESEGAVAVGGTLRFHQTQVATQHTTDSGIGLLARKVDMAGSSGQLQVNQGNVRLGDSTGLDILNRDGNNASVHTKVVAQGTGYDSTPDIYASNSDDDASTVVDAGLFASLFSQQKAVDLAATVSQRVGSNTNGVPATVGISGGTATISLTKGETNYWDASAQQLSGLVEIKFEGDTPSVATGTFLIVSISGTNVTLNFNMAGGA
ncbi:collagen-binding domain-containing protein [Bifidobacterium crudilactis]|jgi:choice-of-anchor A domain-containing protein|uniref:collagen-binding domain-containing protein n=1 Tax=Bifidobacterium crudilactis TaxID=327277 RepID=UPI0023550BE0|nr:collagen-binding domain-containing protein [Bifidobacterium crudilactis]